MSVSKWFDYNSYMNNKLAQMQKAEPTADWTIGKLVSAFDKAGFKGAEGAEQHFAQFGQNEDVAPNAFFNAEEYYRAKAAEFYGKAPGAVTDLDAANMKTAIDNAGMNAWSHYTLFGSNEGVNPSNLFDTNAYMEAKLAAMNAVAGAEPMTMDQLKEAFKTAGLSALEHFMMFGGAGDGEVTNTYDGTIPPAFAVKDENKVPGDVIPGDTFILTTGIDNIVGTAGNDTIIAGGTTVGTDVTLNAGDQIDGGDGIDTLKIYGDNGANFGDADIKNVEIVANYAAKAIDVSGNADVKEVWMHTGSVTAGDNKATANKTQIVGFDVVKGNIAAEADFKDATAGGTDAATIAVKNAGADTAYTSITVANIDNLTVDATGTNKIGDLKVDKAQTITFTGTGSVVAAVKDTTTLKSVDASTNTGGVDLSLTTGLFDGTIAVTGGAGNDTITFTNALAAKATIDLGAGDNTLSLKQTSAPVAGSTFKGGSGTNDTLILDTTGTVINATNGKMFTGFEHLVLKGVSTYNVGYIDGITSYEIASAGAVTLGNMANNMTVTESVTSLAVHTLTLADPSAPTSSVNVVLDNNAVTAGAGIGTVIDTNAHILNVESAGNVTGTDNSVTFAGTTDSLGSVTNVNITGDQNFSLTTGVATALSLIDGSKATGELTITATGATHEMTIKGGSADDTIVAGVAAKSTIIGGEGADTITLGTANATNKGDVIKLTSHADSTADGFDIVTNFSAAAATADKVDVSAFGFTGAQAGMFTLADGTVTITGTGTAGVNFTIADAAAKNFFDNAGTDKGVAIYLGSDDNSDQTFVFIDVDKNGDWNADTDSVIVLAGDYTTTTGALADGNFSF